MNEEFCDLTRAKKAFSRIGLAFCAIVIITTVLQLILILGADTPLMESSWGMWLVTFLPMYLVAIPVGLWILRPLPAEKPADNPLSVKEFLVYFTISICVMYAGNLIGTNLSARLSGGSAENAVISYAMDTNPLKLLFMVVLAPLLEEYICRKQLIDRTRQYGEKTAVVLSALVFGLLHQNLFQFFYAFGLGLVFAYIYTRTGRLRYPVLLHGMINFMGSVLAPWILSLLDMETLMSVNPNAPAEELVALYSQMLPGLIALMVYFLFLLGMSVAGFVLLLMKIGKLSWQDGKCQLPKGTAVKTVYLNVGMILYILLCTGAVVLALL